MDPAPAAAPLPTAPLPSSGLEPAAWEAAHEELVALLRDLIRIPSINPPDPAGPELDAARHLAAVLRAEGLDPEVIEPVPGRGSVVARLRGDGTGGDPLLLLSHHDVVPADVADGWTHDPFAADIEDGYVWGRGAVDMKQMVALEMMVVALLARRARAAGLDPARDPIPGLRRDVLFACTADEEAGGRDGAGWLAANRPETLRAAGALNEAGAVSVDLAGRRFYPIQVAEKGFEVFRIHVHGTWGHGSMPRDDNAAVMAAEAVRRLAIPGEPRLTAPMRPSSTGSGRQLPPDAAELVDAVSGDDPRRSEAAIRSLCDPMYARAMGALVRDSISPDVIHAGIKYNVIPGEAMVEIDCRTLPGDHARRHARGGPGAAGRPGPPVHRGAHDRPPARGGPSERGALRPARGHDPGPRPRRHPGPGAWRRSRRTPSPPCSSTPDLRLLAAPPGRRTSASSSASTASTSAVGPRGACAGALPRPVRRGRRVLRVARLSLRRAPGDRGG